jgi:pimeloyl-ACP methyl ester carboxylesterase
MMNKGPKSGDVYVDGGIKIHYWDWGNFGPAMLLVHPSGAFGRIWDPLAKLIYDKFHIIAVDLRGHGDSDKPKGGYSAEAGSRDVLQLIDLLKLKSVVFVSHSLGTRIGIVLAAENPRAVNRFVMVGAPHYAALFPDSPDAKEERERFHERARMWARIPKVLSSKEEAMAFLRRPLSLLRGFDNQVLNFIISSNTNQLPDGRIEWKWDPEAVGSGLMHAPDDLTGYVSRLKCPILVPYGVRKFEQTPERIQAMKERLPTSRWVPIHDAEYYIFLEKPEELARVILEFAADLL